MKMEAKKLVNYFIDVIYWISLLIASLSLIYFVKDIFDDYKSRKTNDRMYSETIEYYEHPTVTICFEPGINITKLKEYNLTIDDYRLLKNGELDVPIPLPSLVNDISFNIIRDFIIEWQFHNFTKESYVSIHNGKQIKKNAHFLSITEFPLYIYGKCFIFNISQEIKTPVQMYNILTLRLKSEDYRKLPIVKAFFTSKENAYGASMLQWMEGERFALTINPREMSTHYANLRLRIRKKLEEKSNCSSDVSYYKCMAKTFLEVYHAYESKSCLPFKLKNFLIMANEEKYTKLLQICDSWKKENQSLNVFQENIGLLHSCKSSCIQNQYIGDSTFVKEDSIKAPNEIQIVYIFANDQVQISEEYLMFGINDLIGTVGGHCGLFVGFSFYGFICQVLGYIKNKFFA